MKSIRTLSCLLFFISPLSGQTHTPAAIIKFDKVSSIIGGKLQTSNGVEENYLLLDESSQVPPMTFGRAINDDFTITAWIRPDDFIDEGKGGFSERSPATIMQLIGDPDVNPDASGYIRVKDHKLNLTLSSDGEQWQPVSGSQALIKGKWTHIAMVVRNGNVDLYIDGQKDASGAAPRNLAFDRVVLGRMQSSRKWIGGLDSILIYNEALTPEQIQGLAEAPSAQS